MINITKKQMKMLSEASEQFKNIYGHRVSIIADQRVIEELNKNVDNFNELYEDIKARSKFKNGEPIHKQEYMKSYMKDYYNNNEEYRKRQLERKKNRYHQMKEGDKKEDVKEEIDENNEKDPCIDEYGYNWRWAR